MSWMVPLSDLSLDEEDSRSVQEVMQSQWLSMGPVTSQFEDEFASYLSGDVQAIGVSSGTAALHLAQLALGIGPGDEVIVPSLTFVATANSTLYCGGRPVFIDVTGTDDLNISPDAIAEAITPRTAAITVVHYAGYPCDMRPIMEIAEDHAIPVIEDAAHAVGARYRGESCGTIGRVGCFSFFANKNLATGEGGMITTSDSQLAERMRRLRSHGMTTLTWDRHRGHAHSYDVVDLGFNYRMNEIAAALGRNQLARLAARNDTRRTLTELYWARLGTSGGIRLPFRGRATTSACHILPVMVNEGDRNDVIMRLHAGGVQTSIHYPPIHLFRYYREHLGTGPGQLPLTESIARRQLTLPLYPGLARDAIEMIGDMIDETIACDETSKTPTAAL
jgi:dTDP-4-amino-4,6-dideoxygalactose transaminase